ncbi:MAG: glutamine synthetase type III [Ruminococcaceae bacterium]|nr:glutamine synthetase type III [Oscillospiraceae bacterium]
MNKNLPQLFGNMVFNEEVMRQRLPREVSRSLMKTMEEGKEIDPSIADVVANAMKDWAIEKGATHYTHWFQPLTGATAEKHDSFISPAPGGQVVMEFSGKCLIKGEPDASSFPSGGLRATFEARGYTAWDPASYAFVKDGTLYIPTAFCSYTGEALDSKTPLLRSIDAISREGMRILRLFGDTTAKRLTTTVGAEQEYFIIDKAMFEKRRDLIYTGRTLFGAPAPKGQELEDHYFGPLKTRIAAFMAELDEELWKLGILSKTKHNEAAPAQHELAPIFTTTNMSVDQNLLIMIYMKRIAEKHGLVCLLHEKPFAGVSGSGKHNNWSVGTDTGKNLFKPGKTPAENKQFLLMLAAVIKAVDEYQDLLRISVAHAGNDHRLGAAEAPPAIVSMFIGDDLQAVVDAIVSGTDFKGSARGKMNLGIPSVPIFTKDTSDRNRTSPFAFTGNKFEFRMLGSSQNISLPNVVLNTAVAESFRQFADVLEQAEDFDAALAELIKDTFTKHQRILFNGNGYSGEWEKEATRRGLSNLKTTPEAIKMFTAKKHVALFTAHGVMSEVEMRSREEIMYENYAKVINIEAQTMIDMAGRDIIPAVTRYAGHVASAATAKQEFVKTADVSCERDLVTRLSALTAKAYDTLGALREADNRAKTAVGVDKIAESFLENVIPLMQSLRKTVDEMETLTATEYWPMPGYGELLFSV